MYRHNTLEVELSVKPIQLTQPKSNALSLVQQRLISEVMIDLNVSAAAKRCGLTAKDAYRYLEFPHVASALKQAYEDRTTRVQVDADEVLRSLARVMRADARELGGPRRVNCRYCWGHDHRRQYTQEELRVATAAHVKFQMTLNSNDRVEFDDEGGDGFDPWKDPYGIDYGQDHNCPECGGAGEVQVWIPDLRDLSPEAAAIYSGVKITKDGSVQILARREIAHHTLLMQHLGMLVQRNVNLNIDLFKLSDEQLNEVLKQVVDSGLLIDGEMLPADGGAISEDTELLCEDNGSVGEGDAQVGPKVAGARRHDG